MTAARVFVVEDEAMIAMELCDRLRVLGYDVLGMAANGEQALREIAGHTPDLVLMDINLTGALTGLDVARGLRERQLDAAIVFLTAFSGDEKVREATGVEAAGYLVKPFDERELHATLQVAHFKRAADRERRQRLEERHALEARLGRAEKDESLGRMAGALAHTFNNAFSGILGLVELARADLDNPAQCAADLDEAAAEIGRAAEFSRGLRRYAGGSLEPATDLELGRLCREATALLEASVPKSVRLSMRVPDAGQLVHADANLLREALMQLVTNAAEAMAGGGGELSISVGTVGGGELRVGRTWPAEWSPAGGTWAYLAVRDAGGGIAPADLDRIFDPFFSTKFLGRGLGLALVLSTVSSFGGAVSVETGATGSTFRLLFPVKERPEGHEEES